MRSVGSSCDRTSDGHIAARRAWYQDRRRDPKVVMSGQSRQILAGAAFAAAIGLATAAGAHPHVLVDARAEIVFDSDGRISALRHIWQFDPAFTAYAIQGLDADGDNQLSDAELQPLAEVNVESLAEFGFFTSLTIGGEEVGFEPPDEYWLDFHDGRLTLFYTLPLAVPAAPGRDTALEVYDPEYFVAFSFVDTDPVALVGDATGCQASYRPPAELDGSAALLLSQIPADQRELPPDLAALTGGLANRIEVACPD
jgi:ABC-type uncharacterized transport system substrate-binding protein